MCMILFVSVNLEVKKLATLLDHFTSVDDNVNIIKYLIRFMKGFVVVVVVGGGDGVVVVKRDLL